MPSLLNREFNQNNLMDDFFNISSIDKLIDFFYDFYQEKLNLNNFYLFYSLENNFIEFNLIDYKQKNNNHKLNLKSETVDFISKNLNKYLDKKFILKKEIKEDLLFIKENKFIIIDLKFKTNIGYLLLPFFKETSDDFIQEFSSFNYIFSLTLENLLQSEKIKLLNYHKKNKNIDDKLFEIVSSFYTLLDFKEAANTIIEKLAILVNVSQGYILSVESNNFIKIIANYGDFYGDSLQEMQLPLKKAIIKRDFVLFDRDKTPEVKLFNFRKALIIPLSLNEKISALICLGETSPDINKDFTQEEVQLSKMVSKQAAITLQNAKMHNGLEDMVIEKTVDLIESNNLLKTQKKELENLSVRLQSIINSNPEGIIVLNQDSEILNLNPVLHKVINKISQSDVDFSNLIGKNIIKLLKNIEYKDDKNKEKLNELLDFIFSRNGIADLVLQYNNKNVYFKVLVAPFMKSIDNDFQSFDLENSVNMGKIVVFHDITKEKELEKLKSDFTAVISHELKTPVSAMMGFANIIEDELVGDVNDKQKDYLRKISVQGERLIKLINNLLDFSKLEAGQMPVFLQLSDVSEIVYEVVEMLHSLLKEKQLTVETNVADYLPEIEVDPDKVKQILINLIGNAIKFSPKETGLIIVSVTQDDDELVFCVRDNGIGIPSDEHQKLFHKFHQVDNTSTRKFGGTGLGLAIVKKLVELKKGRVWVESEVNKGSAFYFTIPLNTV